MKKTLQLLNALILSMLFTFSAFAQLPTGSIAPDFTGTDINGNTHHLYSLLDSGYTVIMDVSATWCAPCWSYHQTGALEDTWTNHGPDGDNTARVFFVEGDAATTLADLNGTGGNTQGDWVSITDYPIIDDHTIGDLYETTYFPTVFAICPDRTLTLIDQAPYSQIQAEINACPVASGINNARAFLYLGTELTCGDVTPEFSIQNLGSSDMTSATVTLYVDGVVQETVNWTGTLSTFQSESVIFTDVAISSDVDMYIEITNVNGMMDDDMSDNTSDVVTVGLAAEIPTQDLVLDIVTDQYSAETYWVIMDESGNIAFRRWKY